MQPQNTTSSRSKGAIRYARLKEAGLCTLCAKAPLIENYSRCAQCLALYHARQAARAASGICRKCGKQPSDAGRRTCPACHAHERENEQRRDRTGYSKARREQLLGQGTCCVCAQRPAIYGRTLCIECHGQVTGEHRRRKIGAGLCAYCGKRGPEEGRKCCTECLVKQRRRHHSRKDSGLCITCQTQERQAGRLRCFVCAIFKRASKARSRRTIREEVFAHYGNRCACCGETTPEFLTIDHINNDGATQRRLMAANRSISSSAIYAWIRRNRYPDDLQILCWNCNCAKGIRGGCPHQTQAG